MNTIKFMGDLYAVFVWQIADIVDVTPYSLVQTYYHSRWYWYLLHHRVNGDWRYWILWNIRALLLLLLWTLNCTVSLTFIIALSSLPLGWQSPVISVSSSELKQRGELYKKKKAVLYDHPTIWRYTLCHNYWVIKSQTKYITVLRTFLFYNFTSEHNLSLHHVQYSTSYLHFFQHNIYFY